MFDKVGVQEGWGCIRLPYISEYDPPLRQQIKGITAPRHR